MIAVGNTALINLLMAIRLIYGMSEEGVLPPALVKQLAAAYPAFTEPMIGWWIFNADRYGFNVCIIRIGGRVLVDRVAFEHWLEAHRVGKPESIGAL